MSADLARHEREQDFLDESDRVRDAIEAEVALTASRTIAKDPELWSRYFTEYCAVENLPEECRDLLSEGVRLLAIGGQNYAAILRIHSAYSAAIQDAADRYTTDETKRRHDDWLRERGRK